MSAPKFTPGPWVVFADDSVPTMDVLPAMREGVICTIEHITDLDEARANAALISASTALYEALKAMVEPYRGFDEQQLRARYDAVHVERILRARAALSLANPKDAQ